MESRVELFHLILAFFVVRLANADEETCRVDRKADVGLAEYKPGAQNLRTDYDVTTAEECFQRCCNYSDSAAGNRCNAASYYKVADMYPVCVLLSCNPFSSCVWKPSANFTAARIQSRLAQGAVQSYGTVSQIATLNQSTVTSQGPVNPVTTQQQQQQQTTTPETPAIQDWNVNNWNVPPAMLAPGTSVPDSAIQGAAVDQPTQPFNQQDQPFNQQDQPFNQQNQSFNQQNQSFNQPNQPFNQQGQPFNQQDQSFNQPNQPSNQQDQPFNQQDQPSNQQDQSSNQQDQPFNQQDQPFNQQDQPSNQQDQPSNQQDQPFNQQDQPSNQPEPNANQPFDFNDALVPVVSADDWPEEDNEETASSSSSSSQNPDQTPTSEDAGATRVRPLLNQSPGIIIGLCSALGVSCLVLVAICRKIYQAGDKPKYKPLRDYDIRFEPPVASSALLP